MIDAYTVSLLKDELNRELVGGRIDKIQQPAKELLLLTVRKDRENKKLLISCTGGKARVHLTSQDYENPKEPPMFCMLLRKHLTGAEILSIEQPNDDRILIFHLSNADVFGRGASFELVCEMLGRSPNVILCDESKHITDCLHRNEYRNPGLIYRLPEKPAVIPLKPVERIDGSPSVYLDAYYSALEKTELYKSKAREVRTVLNNAVKRTEKKLGARMIELERTAKRDELRMQADLITANIYRIKKGDSQLRCTNWFEGDREEIIELDPLKTPQQYAAKLYKDYNKLKTAEIYLTGLIDEASAQLDFLKSEQDLLSRASTNSEIEAIKIELIAQGFMKQAREKGRAVKQQKNEALRETAPSGNTVLIGRSNTQNDELTFRIAGRTDYWFHAKDWHGSHVILICEGLEPKDEDILFAARKAAEHSEAAGSCLVDYCPIRNVKKQKGSLPGMVTYTDYKTVRING